MKKVVINVCFGGFGLSKIAEKRYLELCGKDAFFYEQTKYSFRDGEDEYTRVDPEADTFLSHTVTENYGEKTNNINRGHYWSDYGIARDDPKLVQVVEELGTSANGECADLKIVEIPDGVAFEISEYDGNEHIAESHRTWR